MKEYRIDKGGNTVTEPKKNRRGAVIETAISFMLLMFALCAMTTTIAVSVKMRTDRTLDYSNVSYSLDQLGEYFLRALEGKSTIDFTKDASDAIDDDESPDRRGGWIKFINSPEDEDEPVIYGLNFSYVKSDSSYIYTMRIVDWDKIAPDGSYSEDDCELIVTAKYDQGGMESQRDEKLEILNWSDSSIEVKADKYDPEPARDMSWWRKFHGFFGRLFGRLFFFFRRVMRWRFR